MPLLNIVPAAGEAVSAPDGSRTSASMLFACWAIVVVLLAMVIIFLRARKKEYAVAILPLLIAPVVHIFSGVAAKWLDTAVPPDGGADLLPAAGPGLPRDCG